MVIIYKEHVDSGVFVSTQYVLVAMTGIGVPTECPSISPNAPRPQSPLLEGEKNLFPAYSLG